MQDIARPRSHETERVAAVARAIRGIDLETVGLYLALTAFVAYLVYMAAGALQ
ncbi:MAG: hypothetical protein ACRDFS_10930 [Chloroflexota bacterium]